MEKYIYHTVTQQDIDNNPDGGLVLGEVVGIPASAWDNKG